MRNLNSVSLTTESTGTLDAGLFDLGTRPVRSFRTYQSCRWEPRALIANRDAFLEDRIPEEEDVVDDDQG